jgi:hypothetical protein
VWDPAHRRAAEALALAPHRRHLRVVPDPVNTTPEGGTGLGLGGGDWEVEPIDLARYDIASSSTGGFDVTGFDVTGFDVTGFDVTGFDAGCGCSGAGA